jgi:IS5 family transposase
LLEDEAVLEPVILALEGRWAQSRRRGRPGTPAEVVLRMLLLKHLYGWSYDTLEREVRANLVYRGPSRGSAAARYRMPDDSEDRPSDRPRDHCPDPHASGRAVHPTRPADVTLWTPALARHQQIFGRPPILAAAQRGFASAANEEAARKQGVRRVVLPRPGRTTPTRRSYERQRWLRRGGCEGRISVLKHRHGLKRSRYHGLAGCERWVGLGVIADNLLTLARTKTPKPRRSV